MAAWWWWCKWIVVLMVGSIILEPVASDPQINLLNKGCSQYNASNVHDFFDNLNATFADLRNQLTNGNKLFATAQQAGHQTLFMLWFSAGTISLLLTVFPAMMLLCFRFEIALLEMELE